MILRGLIDVALDGGLHRDDDPLLRGCAGTSAAALLFSAQYPEPGD